MSDEGEYVVLDTEDDSFDRYAKSIFQINYNKEIDDMIYNLDRVAYLDNHNPKYEKSHITKFQRGKRG